MSKSRTRDFRNALALIVDFLNFDVSEDENADAMNQLKREVWEDIKLARSAIRLKKSEGSGRLGNKSQMLSSYPVLFEGRQVGSLYLEVDKLSPGPCRVKVENYEFVVKNISMNSFGVKIFGGSISFDRLKTVVYDAAHWASINGQLERLRQCKHCCRFFVLSSNTRRFCSKECARAWDKNDAKRRVKEARKSRI